MRNYVVTVGDALRAPQCPACFWDDQHESRPRYFRRPAGYKELLHDARSALADVPLREIDPSAPDGVLRWDGTHAQLPPVTEGDVTVTLSAFREFRVEYVGGTFGLLAVQLHATVGDGLLRHHAPRLALTADTFAARPVSLSLVSVLPGGARFTDGRLNHEMTLVHNLLPDARGLGLNAARYVARILGMATRPPSHPQCRVCSL